MELTCTRRRNVLMLLTAAAIVGVLAACTTTSDDTGGTSPPADAPSIVVLGDSLTAAIGHPDQADQDWFSIANAKGYFEFAGNAGVGGEETDQILARVDRDVLAREPDWCTVLAGTNDVFHGVDADTIITNLGLIYDKLAFTEIGIIAFTVPPLYTGDPAKSQTLRDVNAWMRDHVESDWPDAHLVDWSSDLSGGGDEADPVSAYVIDGIHFNRTGATVAGLAAEPVFAEVTGR